MKGCEAYNQILAKRIELIMNCDPSLYFRLCIHNPPLTNSALRMLRIEWELLGLAK